MEKIYCSVEPWDSILGTNRPNGTSRTWNYQETGTPSPLFTLTDELIKNDSPEEIFYNTTLFMNSDELVKLEIHEIKDKKHLYIIRVLNHQFFRLNLNVGFSPISPKVLVDVKEGNAKIILEMTSEGQYFSYPGTELAIIERWRIKEGLPPYSVAVISGNLLAQKLASEQKYELNVYGVSTFEGFFPLSEELSDPNKIIEYKPCNNKNLFLSYNRAQRLHRAYLVAMLNESRLLDRGLISYQLDEINFSRLSPELYNKEAWRKLKLKGPRFIDYDQSENLAQNTDLFHYEQTFLHIVTETTISNNSIFFSEKIFKPMAFGQPFLLVGNPFSLKKLKEMGYQTFDKWFDESYDNETDEYRRIQHIVKIVDGLRNKTVEELQAMREEMKSVLLHNKKHYITQSKLKFPYRYYLAIMDEIRTEWKDLNTKKAPKFI